MRPARLLTIAFAATALTVACVSDSGTVPKADDAKAAADVFTRLTHSVERAGADVDLGLAYSSLAHAVREGGRVTPIVGARFELTAVTPPCRPST